MDRLNQIIKKNLRDGIMTAMEAHAIIASVFFTQRKIRFLTEDKEYFERVYGTDAAEIIMDFKR